MVENKVYIITTNLICEDGDLVKFTCPTVSAFSLTTGGGIEDFINKHENTNKLCIEEYLDVPNVKATCYSTPIDEDTDEWVICTNESDIYKIIFALGEGVV